MEQLKYNQVGSTSLSISELGFGGASIGNLYTAVTDAAALETVQTALRFGIHYFDTAPRYGHGLSERRFGSMLPEQTIISTKVGRILSPIPQPPAGTMRHGFMDGDPNEEHFDYTYDGVMQSFEDSVKRLGRDKIDILYAHDIGRLTHHANSNKHFHDFLQGGLPAMHQLKREGRVTAIGLGVNEVDVCNEVMDNADIDVILLAGRYTLLEQAPLTTLFPRCASRKVSVIVGGPYNSGILIKGVRNGSANYDYGPAPAEIIERVRKIENICVAHKVPMAAVALQFPLFHKVVASVLPGMGKPENVASNVAYLRAEIPLSLWDELKFEGLIVQDAPTQV